MPLKYFNTFNMLFLKKTSWNLQIGTCLLLSRQVEKHKMEWFVTYVQVCIPYTNSLFFKPYHIINNTFSPISKPTFTKSFHVFKHILEPSVQDNTSCRVAAQDWCNSLSGITSWSMCSIKQQREDQWKNRNNRLAKQLHRTCSRV